MNQCPRSLEPMGVLQIQRHRDDRWIVLNLKFMMFGFFEEEDFSGDFSLS